MRSNLVSIVVDVFRIPKIFIPVLVLFFLVIFQCATEESRLIPLVTFVAVCQAFPEKVST
jgi:hypothetical protein